VQRIVVCTVQFIVPHQNPDFESESPENTVNQNRVFFLAWALGQLSNGKGLISRGFEVEFYIA
jgi:hypothetical protein